MTTALYILLVYLISLLIGIMRDRWFMEQFRRSIIDSKNEDLIRLLKQATKQNDNKEG